MPPISPSPTDAPTREASGDGRIERVQSSSFAAVSPLRSRRRSRSPHATCARCRRGALQHLNRSRYYDTSYGRFTSADSFRGNEVAPPSLHRYVYVVNNPILYTDPTGNTSISADSTLYNNYGGDADILEFVLLGAVGVVFLLMLLPLVIRSIVSLVETLWAYIQALWVWVELTVSFLVLWMQTLARPIVLSIGIAANPLFRLYQAGFIAAANARYMLISINTASFVEYLGYAALTCLGVQLERGAPPGSPLPSPRSLRELTEGRSAFLVACVAIHLLIRRFAR